MGDLRRWLSLDVVGWIAPAAQTPATLLDWLFPPTCLLCGAPGAGRDLCAGCAAELPYNRPACTRCGLPLAIQMSEGAMCGRCRRRPPPFAHCLTALRYEGPVPYLIAGAKFHGRLEAARLLGQCLTDCIQASGVDLPQAIVPVPLHPRRQRGRGYNQALEIARVAARSLAVPIEPKIAARVLATPPQMGLPARARRRNLRGAFVIQRAVAGRHLALVDDVMTTGSTLAELSKALLRAGAARVDVWAVARA